MSVIFPALVFPPKTRSTTRRFVNLGILRPLSLQGEHQAQFCNVLGVPGQVIEVRTWAPGPAVVRPQCLYDGTFERDGRTDGRSEAKKQAAASSLRPEVTSESRKYPGTLRVYILPLRAMVRLPSSNSNSIYITRSRHVVLVL
jgi:hypothetical protein